MLDEAMIIDAEEKYINLYYRAIAGNKKSLKKELTSLRSRINLGTNLPEVPKDDDIIKDRKRLKNKLKELPKRP